MTRYLPTLVVLALLGSTAAAFAVTEGLKLEKSPISRTSVDKVVAPDSLSHSKASIQFVLRKPGRLTVEIVNGGGAVIRTLARAKPVRRGAQLITWDGRNDAGKVVPDGTYRPRVHLSAEHRTILLPNPIRMDATPPVIRLVSVQPRVLTPFGKRRTVRIQYLTNESARAFLYVDGEPRTRVFRFVRGGKIDWGGLSARRLRPGKHVLRLRALDRATNFGPASRALTIVVRDVEVRPRLVRVKAGRHFALRVLNAQRYAVRFRSLRREYARPVLVLRAPKRPGRYAVRVATVGHVATAVVRVRR